MDYINPWEHYTSVMKALSDATRFKIMWLLLYNADAKICSSEIAEVLEETPYNISRHIKILKNARLIFEKKEGTRIFYYYLPSEAEFDSAVKNVITKLPADMMENELTRCRKCLEKRS